MNLVELAGPASDRLEPLVELPPELLGAFGFRRQWTPPLASIGPRSASQLSDGPRRDYCRCHGQESDFKESRRGSSAERARAQASSTTHRRRLPGTYGRASRGAGGSRRSRLREREILHPRAQAHRARRAERVGTGSSLFQRSYGLRTGPSSTWGRSAHWRPQGGAREGKARPEGRARRGMIRLGRDPPAGPPDLTCPTSLKKSSARRLGCPG